MIGRVLVVDDLDLNVKTLATRLEREYYIVDKAFDGEEALREVEAKKPDIILLDIMMPRMNGIEVCRTLKANAETRDIPIIMVTALDATEDRVAAFKAGADDFLTKPIDDLTLFARIRNLLQLKSISDELRAGIAERAADAELEDIEQARGRILLVDDWDGSRGRVAAALADYDLVIAETIDQGLEEARLGGWDLVISNLSPRHHDGLRLCAQIRMGVPEKAVPLLVIADIEDKRLLARAFDLGAADHIPSPLDTHEIQARVRTQIAKSRRQVALRRLMRDELELALTDGLTGVGNRRHFDKELDARVKRAAVHGAALILVDIDHFKAINDTHGHAAGDAVLKELGDRLRQSIRGNDFVARTGGEEFAVLLSSKDEEGAAIGAERLRIAVEARPFRAGEIDVPITISLGLDLVRQGDTPASLYRRVDEALYGAKHAGRNRVMSAWHAKTA